MADTRPPGDTTVKTEYRPAYWKFMLNGKVTNSGTNSVLVNRSYRPTYNKGAVISLPGGGKFRKATSYSHESWETGTSSAAMYTNQSGSQYTYDEGREFNPLSGNPRLVGINIPTDARNESVTKALNKLADQKVNLGENIATFRQTLGMFVSKGNYLLNALKAIRREKSFGKYLRQHGRYLMRTGKADATAGLYLEYVYGLKPLMQDVYALHELLKGSAVEPMLLSAKGSAQRTVYRGNGNWSYGGNSRNRTETWNANYTVKTRLWARVDPEHRGLRALNQLGLLNPAGLAWDLVSYSFVLDWFVPIGPVLYALTARAGLIFVDGSIAMRNSETRTVRYEVNYGATANPPGTVVSALFPVAFEQYKRETFSSWPLPGFWVAPEPFSADRPLKALALGIQSVKRSGTSVIRHD